MTHNEPTKTNTGIIILLVFIVLGLLASSCTYNGRADQTSDDSVVFIQYSAFKVVPNNPAYSTDTLHMETVYIDTTEHNAYQVLDTVEVNKNGVIPAAYKTMPIYDEDRQPHYPSDWHWVVLLKQTGTKTFSRNQAESQQ